MPLVVALIGINPISNIWTKFPHHWIYGALGVLKFPSIPFNPDVVQGDCKCQLNGCDPQSPAPSVDKSATQSEREWACHVVLSLVDTILHTWEENGQLKKRWSWLSQPPQKLQYEVGMMSNRTSLSPVGSLFWMASQADNTAFWDMSWKPYHMTPIDFREMGQLIPKRGMWTAHWQLGTTDAYLPGGGYIFKAGQTVSYLI